ncbi:stearoyl-CoA desaturase [Acrasis kona]|uniref:Stearoyl-CoA desaturase n=1 Tax=Acrasis kona TaxID=1008807 RepID=A0AAW2ZJV2_9EUKA
MAPQAEQPVFIETIKNKQPKKYGKTITKDKVEIWWSNAILFISYHIIAAIGMYYYWTNDWRVLTLFFLNWQIGMLGITLGYHRFWSHKSYDATLPLRIVLAIMGTCGFQGSIKWWVLRHRLHHRYTDTDSDPYSSKRGLFYSHVGWIFVKSHYPKMKLIDQSDLNDDPVVRFQHKYFIPLALSIVLVVQPLLGYLWFGDATAGLIWGGFIARIAIWHCTFFINSLAHYLGDQDYSFEVTARGNLILAMLTNGEGWHNYHHSFPFDYRNGVKLTDWDPTKWIIYALHTFTNLVPTVRRIPAQDIEKARKRIEAQRSGKPLMEDTIALPEMTLDQVKEKYHNTKCVIIENYVVDVEKFGDEHPGGEQVFKAYYGGKDCTAAYIKLNRHSEYARSLVERLRVAKISQ